MGWFLGQESGQEPLPVVRLKNKFAAPENTLVGGFRDIMICVIFTGSGGLKIIGEIQIHDRKYFEIKQQVVVPVCIPV